MYISASHKTKYIPSQANTKIFVERAKYFDYSLKNLKLWQDATGEEEAAVQNDYVTTPFLGVVYVFKKNSTP